MTFRFPDDVAGFPDSARIDGRLRRGIVVINSEHMQEVERDDQPVDVEQRFWRPLKNEL